LVAAGDVLAVGVGLGEGEGELLAFGEDEALGVDVAAVPGISFALTDWPLPDLLFLVEEADGLGEALLDDFDELDFDGGVTVVVT
jgi:hypothetical protein